jgi:hypothetical protein
MPLLEAQHALRLDAERPQPVRRPAATSARHTPAAAPAAHVNLVAQFADEADAHQRAATRDRRLPHAEIRESGFAEVRRSGLQQLAAQAGPQN